MQSLRVVVPKPNQHLLKRTGTVARVHAQTQDMLTRMKLGGGHVQAGSGIITTQHTRQDGRTGSTSTLGAP